ncbi:hypothetical protein CCHR01_16388 [Colletotrichum chrysophilum]|uniref:RRM domain-containing protein n=1 Tax=Colletotrichum chrysophilum TaxID=1836956 RepID=A0AAD9A4G6_9PEZI|nr:hypothetical protein K456DRAFT_45528 [Colletotrichum gloeosporioides 23]KAK1840987.1 hypothetical protein CCHR01_16388 [Colletotrichum chrysophilum]
MQVGQLPPGPETGNFYIPICNLPFDTRWQALKEWLSRDCEVDYIQLYHPTSGWIRVKGPYNFYRACDRLKDGVFNGRRIIYDDSNMTSAIVVKEVHNDENAIPVNGTVRSRQPTPAPFSAQIDHQPSPYSYASSEASSFEQQVPTDLGHFSQGYDGTQIQGAWCPEYPAYVSNSGFFPSTAAPTNQPSQAVSVEHRRIIIRRIGHSTPEDQIKALIKQSLARVTPVKAELQRIDVPRGSGSQNRGHAFATFRTADIARSVAESLNGKTWNSRRLEARLTTEGVAEEQASRASPTPTSSSSSRQKKCDSSRKKTSEKARAPVPSGSASRPPEPSSSRSLRQGSSGSSSLSSVEPSSSRQTRSQQPAGPVIADGTSRRSRSESKEGRRK